MVYVLITVDTEAHRGKNPIDEWVYGRYKGEEYGIARIMDLCEKFGFKATFFLDLAECATYGDEAIKEIGEKILSRGFDVQLHIHPDHLTKDRNRLFLHQYSFEEQFKIISYCIDKFKELFGRKPLAFRAGKYSANYDTLDILNKTGLTFDFSMFYSNKWCGLNNPALTINNPVYYKKVVEIPVTVFNSFRALSLKRYDSLSLDGCSYLEFKRVISDIVNKGKPKVVVLMLHSFSFIKRDFRTLANLKGIKRNVLKKVERELEFLAELEKKNLIKIITVNELEKMVQNGLIISAVDEDYIPSSGGIYLQYPFLIKRSLSLFGKNKKATLFILSNVVLAILLFVFLTLLLK